MPLVIHPRVRKAVRRFTATSCVAMFATTGVALFAGTGAAVAAPDCQHITTSTPFAQFGDTNDYFLVPGGDFQGTAAESGWALSNASLTSADAPAAAGIGTETQSLLINGGGSAVSPTFCIDSTMPSFRFVAKQVTTGGALQVEGVLTIKRWTVTVPITTIADGSMATWAPVSSIKLPAPLLPKWARLPVQLKFAVAPGSGSWELGDVYVDPYRSA
jgi:hypothetical protein